MRGLTALQQSTTSVAIRSSFYWTGIQLNYSNGIPEISVNVCTWLIQQNSPDSDTKEGHYIDTSKK